METVLKIKSHILNKIFLFGSSILLLLILITYFNSFGAQFVSDDIPGILNNPHVGDPSVIFAQPLLFFRPLLLFISHSFGGMNPVSYRIFNLLFHTGTVVLLYLFLTILFELDFAFFASVLFAVHPILTESVTWISGVSYPQYSFFLMFSLLTYVLSKKQKQYYVISLVVFLLALFSSEKAVILPVILIVLEWSFYSIKKNWKKILPYFALSIIVGSLLTLNIGARVSSFKAAYYIKPTFYNPLIQIPTAISSYLQLIFWPNALTLYHSELAMSSFEFVVRVIVFLCLLVGIVISYSKSRPIFFWLLFFLIAISPTLIPLNIVWVVAERYVYLGTIGVICATTYLLLQIARIQKYSLPIYILIAVSTLALMTRSIIRNQDWSDADNLWIATGKTSPTSPQNHNNLGSVYTRRKEYQRAIQEYNTAIQLDPGYGDAYHNLADLYVNIGEFNKAIPLLDKALQLNPRLWQSHWDLALIYYKSGMLDKAKEEFKRVISLDPQNAPSYSNLGFIYLQQGNRKEALKLFHHALDLDPTLLNAKQGLVQTEK